VLPPAANGTTTRTGRVGHAAPCAKTVLHNIASTNIPTMLLIFT